MCELQSSLAAAQGPDKCMLVAAFETFAQHVFALPPDNQLTSLPRKKHMERALFLLRDEDGLQAICEEKLALWIPSGRWHGLSPLPNYNHVISL